MEDLLPNPPAQLKPLLPFVQRANELRTVDKVIAYWCCYYAAQLGISGNAKETEAKMYLLTLMDTLEDLKAKLADNDAVINDAASSAYVENFALKVFVGADNEDRAGKATRTTAKKFLAASQFIELLKIFGALEPEMQDKIKYAKWKAADIAKAFKEGRRPQPGPAGGDSKVEAAHLEASLAPSTVESQEEQEYLAREIAKLTTPASDESSANLATTSAGADGAVPNATDIAPSSNLATSRADISASHNSSQVTVPPSHPNDAIGSGSPDADEMWKSNSKPIEAAMSRSSSVQRTSLDRPQVQPSSSFTGLGSSPGSRPLPVPPQRDGLPIPPISAHEQLLGSPSQDQASGPGAAPASFWGATSPAAPPSGQEDSAATSSEAVLPSVPSNHPPSATVSSGHPAIERIDPPLSPSAPSLPDIPGPSPGPLPGVLGEHNGPSHPFTPPAATPPNFVARSTATLPTRTTPSIPLPQPTAFPESLDPKLSTRVQKLAKGAASAVDFEDLETARIQLRQALDILEGRTKA